MESSLKIDQDLSFTEYLRSALYYFNNKKLIIFLAIIYIFPLLPDILALFTIPKFRFNYISLYLSLVPIVLLLITALIVIFIACFYFYYAKPQYFKNISYSITHWGIIRNSETSGFSKSWREIVKYKETKNSFLVYISARDFQVIQKRKFKNSEDISNFRDLLNENVNRK